MLQRSAAYSGVSQRQPLKVCEPFYVHQAGIGDLGAVESQHLQVCESFQVLQSSVSSVA